MSPAGLLAHKDLDERAIEALKEFNEDGALQVLLQFKDSDLSHVQVSALLAAHVQEPTYAPLRTETGNDLFF